MDEVENPEVAAAGQPVISAQDSDIRDGIIDVGLLSSTGQENAVLEDAEGDRVAEPLMDMESGFVDIGIQRAVPAASDVVQGNAGTFKPPLPKDRIALPTRPILKRETSAPKPPAAPPLFPGADIADSPRDPPDSLTLADLRRIRDGFPPTQPPRPQELASVQKVYDYEYQDTQGFQVEIEEWFAYNDKEVAHLTGLVEAFRRRWRLWVGSEDEGSSSEEDDSEEEEEEEESEEEESPTESGAFLEELLQEVGSSEVEDLFDTVQSLCYLVLGNFGEFAGQDRADPFGVFFTTSSLAPGLSTRAPAGAQVRQMIDQSIRLVDGGALESLLKVLVKLCDRDLEGSLRAAADSQEAARSQDEREVSQDLWACLTTVHVLFEVARLEGDTDKARSIRQTVVAIAPTYLVALTKIIGRLRWDEAAPVPISKVFTLHWKAVLLGFGGIERVEEVKRNFRGAEDEKDVRGQPVITASPLDYHLFRQEISSKYPAYQPPKSMFPIEPDNNSILPPLRNRQSRYDTDRSQPGIAAMPMGQSSIMHQPVHIATPAPSPPPSPAGPGGKGGKKQNYQTNQLFPFLYPPLDDASNDIGGKGTTLLQDALAGKRWQGSDVPTSILEAAELFAQRMRATRAMKQMWQARVDFMKYDRGWKDDEKRKSDADDALRDLQLELDELDLANDDKDAFLSADEASREKNFDRSADDDVDAQTEDKVEGTIDDGSNDIEPLPKVAEFYRQSLPHLQSYIIVSLKAVLKQITDVVGVNGGRPGQTNGFADTNGVPAMPPPTENGVAQMDGTLEQALDHIDQTRVQEITSKALTGSILLLLKWFKLSHILRYEYMTQLLLDSNFIPLILKLWQTQDIGRAVHYKLNQPERNFFNLCAQMAPPPPTPSSAGGRYSADDEEDDDAQPEKSPAPSSPDSAAPPPISLRHHSRNSSDASGGPQQHSAPSSPGSDASTTHPPELDELGYAATALPSSPLTRFSQRNTTSLINQLRILQKVTRRKAHRSLLLVSYKSGAHLKKSLRVPVPLMRYYTLKLFKSQVPYCGRKWRQSNMKVITAVWLSVPAELRDDWLVGGGGGMGGAGPGDIDGTVEEALPLEQSLRALTHWWNCRVHPVEMGVDAGNTKGAALGGGGVRGAGEERGFFERELERMEGVFGRGGADGESEDGGDEAELSALVEGYN